MKNRTQSAVESAIGKYVHQISQLNQLTSLIKLKPNKIKDVKKMLLDIYFSFSFANLNFPSNMHHVSIHNPNQITHQYHISD